MYSFETKIRVRYGETDQMGYVYYGNYPLYYEVGRVEMMRSLGFSYKKMEEELGVMLPVMTLNVRYLRPFHYDDEIRIKTSVTSLPKKDITFHMELFNTNGKLANGGTVKLAFVDKKTFKRVNCPEILLKKLSPYFNA